MNVKGDQTDNVVAVPESNLGLVHPVDGWIAILNIDENLDGPCLMVPLEAMREWAEKVVAKNRRGGRPYNLDDEARGYFTRLKSSEIVHCEGQGGGHPWSVWVYEDNKVDFTQREVNALVAFMGTDEFQAFLASKPANALR